MKRLTILFCLLSSLAFGQKTVTIKGGSGGGLSQGQVSGIVHDSLTSNTTVFNSSQFDTTAEGYIHIKESILGGGSFGGMADSLKVLASAPSSGTVWIDSATARIKYKAKGYVYTVSISDSTAITSSGSSGGSSGSVILFDAANNGAGSVSSGTYSAAGDYRASSTKGFPSGTNAANIYYVHGGYDDNVVGVQGDQGLGGYGGMIKAIYTEGTTIKVKDGSLLSTGQTIAVGDYLGLFRDASGNWTAKKSTDGGATWTVVYTWSGTDTTAYYLVFDMAGETGSLKVYGSTGITTL